MTEQLYMRYLGAIGLLARCAVHLREGCEGDELRDMIELAMQDACAHHPLHYRRILNHIEIEIGENTDHESDEPEEECLCPTGHEAEPGTGRCGHCGEEV